MGIDIDQEPVARNKEESLSIVANLEQLKTSENEKAEIKTAFTRARRYLLLLLVNTRGKYAENEVAACKERKC